MKKIPRNRAIDMVLKGHIDDITYWIENNKREQLKNFLINVLGLRYKSVDDMKKEFPFYLPGEEYEEEN